MGWLSHSPALHGTLRWRGSLGRISLFPNVGKPRPGQRDWRQLERKGPWVVRSRGFPCIFRADLGLAPRDGLATECAHRPIRGGFYTEAAGMR